MAQATADVPIEHDRGVAQWVEIEGKIVDREIRSGVEADRERQIEGEGGDGERDADEGANCVRRSPARRPMYKRVQILAHIAPRRAEKFGDHRTTTCSSAASHCRDSAAGSISPLGRQTKPFSIRSRLRPGSLPNCDTNAKQVASLPCQARYAVGRPAIVVRLASPIPGAIPCPASTLSGP